MTEPTSTPRRPARARRLLASTLVLVVAALAVLGAGGPTPIASASGPAARTQAPEIADAAAAALQAHGSWSDSGDPNGYIEYLAARDLTVEGIAAELDLDPIELGAAWRGSHPDRQVAILAAVSQLGVPYRSRTSVEGEGFDCSGLTTYAWGRAGVELERQSRSQINAAERVDRDEAQVADLVYYPGHVMMSIGIDGVIVHSPNSGNHVEIRVLPESRAATVSFGDPMASS